MVETQLCKLRDTSDTLVGRASSIFQLQCNTQLDKFDGRAFVLVKHLVLMKDLDR